MSTSSALPVVIVGSGFSGLCAGILLKQAGIHDFTILEKASALGGTWRANTYPGAACDVQSHLYSYSFEPNPTWSRTFSPQHEILAYLERCAEKYGLGPHLRFGAEVIGATFDDATESWTVRVRGAAPMRARAVILGNGALHLPAFPQLEGAERFTGARFHSAQWDHDYPLEGKRVAVIGTGASAIQFVPQIAPRVAQLHLFQRTPPWILPKPDRPMTKRERWSMAKVPGVHWLRRAGLYWSMEARVLPLVYDQRLLGLGEAFAKRYLARQIADPELRARVTPAYRMGCKRVLISNDYYPALTRPNVELVTDGITEVTARGVRTADGRERAVDAIIYGTGFKVADYLSAMQIKGRGGADLNDAWRAALRSYLGITVAGFPSLFLLMGPGTGLGHNSMIFMIEAQARYAVQAIVAMRDRGLASIDVRPEVQAAFHAQLRRQAHGTVWTSGCASWYQAPSGDLVVWPGFTWDYWRRTRKIDLDDYEVRRAPA